MSNEIIKNKIAMDKSIGKETTQLLLEGDIIVPDIKPDMAVILQTDSNLFINKIEISSDRVNFMGRIDISILYLAKGADKPVHSINVSENVDDFINIEGITKDMWADISAEISSIDYKMLNDRKINYRAVANISVKAQTRDEREVVADVEGLPETQTLKKIITLSKNIENTRDRFTVKDEISVPLGKPSIREVLQTSVTVNNKESKVVNGRVNISGELIVTTLYKGDDEGSLVEFLESEIPFSASVEVSEAREEMFADVSLSVADKYVKIRQDSDGENRVLEIESTIYASVKVNAEENLEILEDAHIINKNLNVSKTPIKYPKLICRNKNQATLKEIVTTSLDVPEALQIYRVSGSIRLDDVKVLEDKVSAEGSINAHILFVAESDDAPLYSYSDAIPFKQLIETKGSKPGDEVIISANVDRVNFNMLSGRETELRFLISFNTQIISENELSMITDIDISDMTESYLDSFASITVYCAQKNDSLWNIAKRYNTTIEEIMSANGLTSEILSPGQKIIILKKVSA